MAPLSERSQHWIGGWLILARAPHALMRRAHVPLLAGATRARLEHAFDCAHHRVRRRLITFLGLGSASSPDHPHACS